MCMHFVVFGLDQDHDHSLGLKHAEVPGMLATPSMWTPLCTENISVRNKKRMDKFQTPPKEAKLPSVQDAEASR